MSMRRRELVRRGTTAVGGALALSLAARAPSVATAQARGDREILEELLRLERGLADLYADLARRGAPYAQHADLFARDCAEHARGLRIALANRGGRTGGEEPAGAPDAGPAAAIELERAAVATYYRAHEGFGELPFIPTLTSIMANHGQHLAVLRRGLGRQPATLAFETGDVE
jgi:hypothetical protein